jgi:hypothetical protein
LCAVFAVTYQPWNWHTSPAVGAALIALLIAVVVQPIISWWSSRRQRLTDADARKEERDEERLEREKERRHERALALNDQRVSAALEFVDDCQLAIKPLGDRYPRRAGWAPPAKWNVVEFWETIIEDANEGIASAHLMVDRIALLFGVGGATTNAARACLTALYEARQAANGLRYWLDVTDRRTDPDDTSREAADKRQHAEELIERENEKQKARAMNAADKLEAFQAAALRHLEGTDAAEAAPVDAATA